MNENREDAITEALLEHGFHIHSVNYEKNRSKEEITYSLTVSSHDKNAARKVFSTLSSMDFVNSLKIIG